MKCDELKQVENPIEWGLYYDKSEVDAAIDELKTENESLLQQNRELCLALQVMYSKEEYDKQKAAHHKERHEYIKIIAELKAENEKLKAQFVPLYDELKRVKDENENLKNNLFVVETDIAMAARWRKVSEELPQNGQDVWAYDSRSKSILLLEYEKSDEGEGFIVFPYKHDFLQNITQWMPFEKPKAPEEADK